MSSGEKKGKKRPKAFYRKSAYGGKRHRSGSNVLEPGIKGFLIMCNSNESVAVKESYNILNEYADILYGQEQVGGQSHSLNMSSEDSECDDAEKAMNKEIDSMNKIKPTERRFQNVMTKAKNCVFIRSTVEDPVKVAVCIMEDIAKYALKKARFAARMLPIIGTCKAHTTDIEKLAKDVLHPIFSNENVSVPSSYTIMFKVRNNNANTCSKASVIPALTKVVSAINPSVNFSWSDFEVAILVEVVCTVCCLGVAPGFVRLRKYNLQELVQGPKTSIGKERDEKDMCNESYAQVEPEKCKDNMNVRNSCNEKSEKAIEMCTSEQSVQTAENAKLKSEDAIKNVDVDCVGSCDKLQENMCTSSKNVDSVGSCDKLQENSMCTSSKRLEDSNVGFDASANSSQEDCGNCKVGELKTTFSMDSSGSSSVQHICVNSKHEQTDPESSRAVVN